MKTETIKGGRLVRQNPPKPIIPSCELIAMNLQCVIPFAGSNKKGITHCNTS